MGLDWFRLNDFDIYGLVLTTKWVVSVSAESVLLGFTLHFIFGAVM